MTIFATGAETRVAIVAETTPGTTPVTPTMLVLPITKLDLEYTQSTYEDTSIQGDRMERYAIAGLRKVTGSLSANLSHLNYGPLLQTAMFGTFASKVLKTGITLNTLTIEEWHIDTTKGFVSTGCFADKLSVKVPVNGIVTIDATINGMNYTTETSSLASSPTAAVVEAPYTHLGGTLTEGGSTIGYLTAIDLTIDNGATALNVLGAQTPTGYTPGMSKVTGTITAWFQDLTLLNKFLNQTASSINFTLTDGTNTLQFNLPNVVYVGLKKPVAGQGAIVLTLPFKALRDSATSSNLIITES
jgi:hypothetical protein